MAMLKSESLLTIDTSLNLTFSLLTPAHLMNVAAVNMRLSLSGTVLNQRICSVTIRMDYQCVSNISFLTQTRRV